MKLFAALLLLASAAPSPEMRHFKYQRAIQLPSGTSGQACLVLDTAIFAHAARDLADVRLYRDAAETPFVIQQATANQAPEQTLTPLNLGQRDGRTVFDAPMPDTVYGDLQLAVSGPDFIATVTVSGSHDAAGPQTRIGAYTIFDLTSQKLGRSTVLHLPRSNFRFLHFEIDGPLGPGRIGGVTVASQPLREPRYLTVSDSVHFEQKGHNSVANFTTPAGLPLDRILFSPPSDPVNFSRDVDVEATRTAPGGGDSSQTPAPVILSGNLLRIHRTQDGHRIDDEQLAIDAPRAFSDGAAKWTITIRNGDDSPIRFTDVRLQMLERHLCFEAAAGAHYSLLYGDNALVAPHYDYAAWFAPQTNPPLAVLEPEQANPMYQTRPDPRPFTEKHPALLWGALILVVLLLAAIALRSAKRVEPPPQMP